MKMSLHILGIILVGLVSISMSDCPNGGGGAGGDSKPAEAGTYSLVSTTFVGLTLNAPDLITGELRMIDGGKWSMDVEGTTLSGDKWDPDLDILYLDSEEISYSFSGGTLRFVLDGITYKWRKD